MQGILNFKLANKSIHKSAMEYLDMEEYVDSRDLHNRTKCEANSQIDEPNLISMTKLIYNPDHNVELGQEDKQKNDEQEPSFNYIIDSNALDNVDLSNKHTSDKVDMIDYNNNNAEEWNYNELEHASKVKILDQNERIDSFKPERIYNPEAKKPGFLVIEHYKSEDKYTNTPEYMPNQQTPIKQQNDKQESDTTNKLEYVYFDKSESEEESEGKLKVKQSDKMDYAQGPMYEMEKTQVKDKSKLKPTHL